MLEHKFFNFNQVVITGRLIADPELKYTTKGNAVTTFGIANSHNYKKGEEWVEETSFINVVVWGESGEKVAERVHKGSPVFVTGRLRQRSWQDKETNQRRSTFDIVADRVYPLAKDFSGTTDQEPTPKAEPKTDPTPTDEEIPF